MWNIAWAWRVGARLKAGSLYSFYRTDNDGEGIDIENE